MRAQSGIQQPQYDITAVTSLRSGECRQRRLALVVWMPIDEKIQRRIVDCGRVFALIAAGDTHQRVLRWVDFTEQKSCIGIVVDTCVGMAGCRNRDRRRSAGGRSHWGGGDDE